MANYQFIVRDSDNMVIAVAELSPSDQSPWRQVAGETHYSKTFDTVAGADIVISNGKPNPGDFYDGTTYTQTAAPAYLDLSWEGNGVDASDMREMVADGTNKEILRLTKREVGTNNLRNAATDTDTYRICVRSSVGMPSVGKVSLVNGTATVDIVAIAGDKGVCEVECIPVPPAVHPQAKAVVSFI